MEDGQFRTPHGIRHKGSRPTVGWTIDPDDEPIVEDGQATTEDDMEILVETEVPHHSEMKALTIT